MNGSTMRDARYHNGQNGAGTAGGRITRRGNGRGHKRSNALRVFCAYSVAWWEREEGRGGQPCEGAFCVQPDG